MTHKTESGIVGSGSSAGAAAADNIMGGMGSRWAIVGVSGLAGDPQNGMDWLDKFGRSCVASHYGRAGLLASIEDE